MKLAYRALCRECPRIIFGLVMELRSGGISMAGRTDPALGWTKCS